MTPEDRQMTWFDLYRRAATGASGFVVMSYIDGIYWANLGGVSEPVRNERIRQLEQEAA